METGTEFQGWRDRRRAQDTLGTMYLTYRQLLSTVVVCVPLELTPCTKPSDVKCLLHNPHRIAHRGGQLLSLCVT